MKRNEPELTDVDSRIKAMEKSIAALERQAQQQARQIQQLLALVSPGQATTPEDEIDAATAYRIRQMARKTIAQLMATPNRTYK